MIKNKKAILAEETLKILIGVLCIALLIYLGVKLYGIFTRSNQIEQAKATLEAIYGKAETLKEEGDTINYLVVSPKGWRFLIYEKKLCLCPESKEVEDQEEMCKSQGVCKEFSSSIAFAGYAYCPRAGSSAQGLTYCLSLKSVPKIFYIKKENEMLKFSIEGTETIKLYMGDKEVNINLQKVIETGILGKETTINVINFAPYIVSQFTNNIQADRYLKLEKNEEHIKIYSHLLGGDSISGRITSDGTIYLSNAIKVGNVISPEIIIYDNDLDSAIKYSLDRGTGISYFYKTNLRLDYKTLYDKL
jgi:hypothetical protein